MARKPENVFISSVHKYLPPDDILHREKTNNPYRGGILDWYYDGSKSDLWIEYKYQPGNFPLLLDISNSKKKPSLSKLQTAWLTRRYHNGKNAVVIVGSKHGGLLLQDEAWLELIPRDYVMANLLTRKEIAEWIVKYTLLPGTKL